MPGALMLCCLALVIAVPALAAESPVVQIRVEPEQVIVGQAVTLRVSVYAPTWFPQPPEFPSFELPNTITRLPPNSSGPVSTRVEGSTWSGVQRRYQVFPLIPGSFLIDSRSITVTYADPQSRSPITVQLPVPEITIEAVVPAGAQDLEPYLAGSSFKLERMIEGDMDALAAGDALVIRYTASIEGLPAVFLPPLWTPVEVAGISAYSAEPVLREDDGRSVREERVTLVFEAGGDFTVPGISLRWWNTRTATVETARLDDLQLPIAGAGLARRTGAQGSSRWRIWWSVVLLIIAAVAGWRLRPRWRRWRVQRQAAQDRYRGSEAYAFSELQHVLQKEDQRESYRQLLRWLWRLEPGVQSSELAVDDAELARQLRLLRAAAEGSASEPPDYAGLDRALAQARRQFLARQSDTWSQVLPALNPQ